MIAESDVIAILGRKTATFPAAQLPNFNPNAYQGIPTTATKGRGLRTHRDRSVRPLRPLRRHHTRRTRNRPAKVGSRIGDGLWSVIAGAVGGCHVAGGVDVGWNGLRVRRDVVGELRGDLGAMVGAAVDLQGAAERHHPIA